MGDHWKQVLSCLTRLGAQPPLDLSQNLFAAGQFPTFVARSPRKNKNTYTKSRNIEVLTIKILIF